MLLRLYLLNVRSAGTFRKQLKAICLDLGSALFRLVFLSACVHLMSGCLIFCFLTVSYCEALCDICSFKVL